jgi:predicted ATPase/DNA-binding winged helix-turn-helix (wHTH) protein
MLRFGPFQLDPLQGLSQGNREIRITPKSLSLLCFMVERAGQTISKEEIFRRIWPDTNVSDAALSSCIQELRSALKDDGKQSKFIETQHRRGYRFIFNPARTSTSGVKAALPAHGDLLVGREQQLEQLHDAWQLAMQGARQVVLVCGDAGVGKSAVVSQFIAGIAKATGALVTWGQCVQHFGAGEPYEPILDALNRLCRQENGERFVPIIQRHGPTWLAQLPSLLPPETFLALQQAIAGSTRERMFRELTETMEALTAEEALILWLEDLHWSDRSTLEWISAFAQRPEAARLLLIGTFRTSEVAGTDHPLSHFPHELQLRGLCRHLSLPGLDQSAIGNYLLTRYPQWEGETATDRLAHDIYARTEGNPLFVINILDSLEERGLIQRVGGTWTLSGPIDYQDLEIPNNLVRAIDALIDRLSAEERSLLEIASVAGTDFSSAMVAAIASISTSNVDERLRSLVRRERVVGLFDGKRNAVSSEYRFLHVLYCDAFYRRLTSSRLQQLHLQVGRFKEAEYENSVHDRPSELAMHFELAREFDLAILYLELAGTMARKKSAYSEARMHFDRAISLLPNIPEGHERTKREVALYAGLGSVLMATYGFGAKEAEAAFAHSRTLSRELAQSPEIFPARWGLWLFYWGRGALKAANEIVNEMGSAAGIGSDTGMLLQTHHAAWATCYSRGELQSTLQHTSEGLRLYDSSKHAAMASTYGDHDAGICCLNFRARALAISGRTSDAVRTSASAIRLATDLAQPLSLATTYVFAASVHQMRRDADAALKNSEAAMEVAGEQGLRLMLAWAEVFAGWANAQLGRQESGLNQIEHGIQSVTKMGTEQSLTHLLAMKADVNLLMKRYEEGQRAIDQAMEVMHRIGERHYESEIYRLAGELAGEDGYEKWLQMAAEVARSQGAELFQLRAMISLAKKRKQPLVFLRPEWTEKVDSFNLEQLPPADRMDLVELNPH